MTGALPPSAGHERYEELAAGYALAALEPGEESTFEAHLTGCRHCQVLLRGFREGAGALVDALPEDPPPAGLGAVIRARALAGRQRSSAVTEPAGGEALPVGGAAPPGRGAGSPRPAERPIVRRLLTAAAAAVVVAGGAAVGWVTTSGPATRPAVAACSVRSGCHAIVLTDQVTHRTVATILVRRGVATVLPRGLPANDPSRNIYVLWQITGRRRALAVAGFDVHASSRRPIVLGPLAQPFAHTWGFAVSLERGRVIPPRPSTPVALGTVSG
jgi:anti-sigma-K factor RskA